MAAAALLLVFLPACAARKTRTSADVLLKERMAAVLLREGRAAEAETTFREVLKDDPHNPEVYDGLGAALMMQGKMREALTYLDKAVELAPEKPAYRINRGLALLEAGRYEEAEADFLIADTSPLPGDRQAAALNRGRLRQRQGDFAGAEVQFTNALARDPRSFAALLGRGVAREASGQLEPAAEDYLEAVKLQPKNPEANLRLGLVLLSLRRESLGRRYLERTLELDPAGDSGAKARTLLEATINPRTPSSR
ncbi:MAG: tetratricopeptide repeat protein [Thermoanaerobaculia bacterium]|nr:tetratricopeptide repeat protein [Thermoanaerobaculia bacterium]